MIVEMQKMDIKIQEKITEEQICSFSKALGGMEQKIQTIEAELSSCKNEWFKLIVF